MIKNKFFQLFSTLTKEEIKQFKLFLLSPLYNTNSALVDLYDALLFLQKKETNWTLQKIWKRAYPDKSFSQPYLRDRWSNLHQLLQQFLVIQQVTNVPAEYQDQLRAVYRVKKMDTEFEKISLAIDLPEMELDWKTHQKAIRVFQDLYAYPSLNRKFQDPAYPRRINHHLDIQYCLLKLKYGLDLVSRSRTFKELAEVSMLEEVIELSEKYSSEHELIQLYRLLLQLYQTEFEQEKFDKVIQYYFEQFQKIPAEDKTFVLIKLLNIAFVELTKGHEGLDKICLKLYIFGLDNDLMTLNGRMADSTFLNIVIYGASTGEFKFVTQFIPQYAPTLNEDIRETATNLGYAYLYFYQKNYNISNDLLQKIKPPGMPYKLRIESLGIRNHYATFRADASFLGVLNNKILAFHKYLTRSNKMSDSRKETYFNFLTAVKHLIACPPGPAAEHLATLLQSLQPLVAKSWLLLQVKNLAEGDTNVSSKD